MRNDKWLALVTMFFATTAACAADGDNNETTASATVSDESTGDTAVTMTDGMTGPMTSATTASTSASTTADTGSTDESTGEEPVEPMPDGASCEVNEECISGFCYFISVLGGICGECNADSDCPDGGCSLPNPLAQPPVGAHCNMGEPGAGCMSDEICQEGYTCETILSVPGILETAACSECEVDTDCGEGMLCSPTYDILNISGQRVCVMPGSVPNGEGCDHLSGTGNDACTSGLCATVDIMMLLQLGVCGDCGVDADCTPPDVCLPADIDITTGEVTPPTCGPAA
jgi:hypothetical protein